MEVCGFHAFDEGLMFYRMLEAFDPYVRAAGSAPGIVDRVLLVISPTETYVYLNERLPVLGRMRVKRSCKAGQPLLRDDIAGIEELDFPGIQPPDECGLMLLVSAGWRKGMCFDFRALDPTSGVSAAESYAAAKKIGGMLLAHLWFTEKFLLLPEDWDLILKNGWFPFILLPHGLWEGLFQAIKAGRDTARSEEEIHKLFLKCCSERVLSWRANRHFAGHMDFLERAVTAYKAGDWLTVVSVAAPRVEGLLRQAFGAWGQQGDVFDVFAKDLAGREHSRSLLFPDRLRQYFEQVFYRFTKFDQADLPATRHTLVHGLVESSKLTRKEALTLLLLVDHILYCMPESKQDPPGAEA